MPFHTGDSQLADAPIGPSGIVQGNDLFVETRKKTAGIFAYLADKSRI